MRKVDQETGQQVIQEIGKYILDSGIPYSNWYVGITDDTEKRLFVDHRVDRNLFFGWIRRKCFDADMARNVEDYFVKLGTRGDTGGGNESSVYVYAYRITNLTAQ